MNLIVFLFLLCGASMEKADCQDVLRQGAGRTLKCALMLSLCWVVGRP